jgi:hypothetical protein
MRLPIVLLAALLLPQSAFAWGAMGHKIMGEVAARNFPDEIPAFLRGPEAAARLGILSQEPDISRNAGQPHDRDLDPGHFLDVSDDFTVLEGPQVSALPASRRDFDTALRAVGADQYKAGFLPYNILDGYQQLVRDFALLRAYQASVRNAGKFHLDVAGRADIARLLSLRQMLTLRDLGIWAHFVEDAAQPMHVSVHYDDWGSGPNPQGFTLQHGLHARFESDFVNANITADDVQARLPAYHPCATTIQACLQASIAATMPLVTQVFALEQAGALDRPTPAAKDFTARRLAAGAGDLRDMVVDAWREAGAAELGYKIKTPVADYESGKAIMTLDPTD